MYRLEGQGTWANMTRQASFYGESEGIYMKHRLKYAGIITGIAVIAVLLVYCRTSINAKAATENIMFQVVNARGVPDGVYKGSYEITPVKVVVLVTIKNESIVGIDILEHQRGLGGKAERIVEYVIQNQRLDIEAVSGATVSSKAILKAVEDALKSAKEEQKNMPESGESMK
jgi:uncharacterized protein with FMN-binding domain